MHSPKARASPIKWRTKIEIPRESAEIFASLARFQQEFGNISTILARFCLDFWPCGHFGDIFFMCPVLERATMINVNAEK